MNIIVYGHDYPALVTAASLASNGNRVDIYPIDAPAAWQWQDTADKQNGLSQLIDQQIQAGRLHWLVSLECPCIEKADVHIMSIQSSQRQLSQSLLEVVHRRLCAQSLWVIQTVQGLGCAQQVQAKFDAAQQSVAVVVWPEFMSEGSAVQQFSRPDRIIIGCEQDWAVDKMRELLRPYNRARDMLLSMSPAAAELTRYAINSLLALRVSAMNEFANLAEKLGVDIEQVRQGIGTDPRIGFNYLYPGAGFGGPNFIADLHATVSAFAEHDVSACLVPAALTVNEQQQEILFSKLWQYYQGQLTGKRVAIWGVSYKPDTATINNASSLRLIDALLPQGVYVRVHDPKALPSLQQYYGVHAQIDYCEDMYAACEACDALLVMTEWKVYWNPDFVRIQQVLRQPLILDGRNIYEPSRLRQAGFAYIGVGR